MRVCIIYIKQLQGQPQRQRTQQFQNAEAAFCHAMHRLFISPLIVQTRTPNTRGAKRTKPPRGSFSWFTAELPALSHGAYGRALGTQPWCLTSRALGTQPWCLRQSSSALSHGDYGKPIIQPSTTQQPNMANSPAPTFNSTSASPASN